MTETINVPELLSEGNKEYNKEHNIYSNLTISNYIRLEETLSISDKIKILAYLSDWLKRGKLYQDLEYPIEKGRNIINKHTNTLKNTDGKFISDTGMHFIGRLDKYPYGALLHTYLVSELIINISFDLREAITKKGIEYRDGYIERIDGESQKKLFFNNIEGVNKLKNVTIIPPDQSPAAGTDKVYVINKAWFDNFIGFVTKVEANNNDIDSFNNIFDKQDVLINWFRNHINSNEIYCGEINNFSIRKYKDYAISAGCNQGEDEDNNTIYLKPNLVVGQDIVLLSKQNYELLKETFGASLYEIKRDFNELFLINLDVLILSKLLISPPHVFQLRKKKIQISKDATGTEFKEIIINYFCDLLSVDKHTSSSFGHNFTIIYTDKLKKIDMFSLIISYQYSQMKIESYIHGHTAHVEGDDDFRILLSKKDVTVIIEYNTIANSSTSLSNTFFKSLPYPGDKCHHCAKTVHPGIGCSRSKNCEFVYCNKKCKKSDKSHAHFHAMFHKFIIVPFNGSTLGEKTPNEYIGQDSRRGLTGGQNLGNTCFMNSALQCGSHCELLTTYFLSKSYLTEINTVVKYGSGGEIAKAYYDGLYQLWVENHSYIHPNNFRSIFTSFAKQFSDYSQHDSHEVGTFMLDGGHEDLNRHKDKQYVELLEQKVGESDKDASVRWWNCNLSRDNSIIVDGFHGQYKNTITCPVCNRISITYDPFMCLGLPIPNTRYKGYTYIINEKNGSIRKEKLNFGSNETYFEVCNTISGDNTKKLHGLFCQGNKSYLKSLKNEDKIANGLNYKENGMIIMYEFDIADINDKIPFFITPVASDPDFPNEITPLFYPKVFYMDKQETVLHLRNKITDYYRRYIEIPEQEYELCIGNNAQGNCEFCNERCNHCIFKFNDTDSINSVKSSQTKSRNFLMLIKFKIKPNSNVKLYHTYHEPEKFNSDITLTDCFDSGAKSEILDNENTWYCSHCKEQREAEKKLEIFKLPKIGIIHLKRFKSQVGLYLNEKIDKYVDFPIEELCLDKYIIDSTVKNATFNYELFAVNRHYGISGGGHYTSLCKNNGNWYEFDDETVSGVPNNHDNIVGPEAYCLFYQLKK